MSRIKLATAATAALLLAAPMAQAAPFHFAGFYAGGHFGYLDAEAEFDSGGNSLSNQGLMGGLQAGYNVLNGNMIWGVEVDISGTDANPSGTCAFNTALDCDINLGPIGTVRARLGYATGDWLFYVTGGAAATHYEVDSQTKAGGVTVDDADGGVFGWTAGAGVERMVGSLVGVKLEYRFMSFSDAEFDSWLGSSDDDLSFDMHVIMAGVNFHF
jgi:outer membrane immunogenic protein